MNKNTLGKDKMKFLRNVYSANECWRLDISYFSTSTRQSIKKQGDQIGQFYAVFWTFQKWPKILGKILGNSSPRNKPSINFDKK
jgi:hypothetical protein